MIKRNLRINKLISKSLLPETKINIRRLDSIENKGIMINI